MRTTVAIIGGGLSGLYAANLLHAAGLDCVLLEARDRLGGRILSAGLSGEGSAGPFDLGPSWFWPAMQPALAALVSELGLSAFPQHNDGDVIFERMSRETPWRYRATHQQPQSMRLEGGTASLAAALAQRLPAEILRTGSRVVSLALEPSAVTLDVLKAEGARESVTAGHVIAAVPPRLLETISFTPPVDPDSLQLWRETPTWMAPHAKFFAVYPRPFWRDAGLSGTAQSFVGPLAEIHDATSASGDAALFGFLSPAHSVRASLGAAAITSACLDQLARLFGPLARRPSATIFKDWASDPYTASPADQASAAHPEPSAAPWISGVWRSRLSLAASETSPSEPGYMAGALDAAARAANEVLRRPAAPAPPPRH